MSIHGHHRFGAPFGHIFDPDRFLPIKKDSADDNVRDDEQILPVDHRPQISLRSTAPFPIVNGHVHRADTLLAKAVHIGRVAIASLLARCQECLEQRVCAFADTDLQRTGAATIVILTQLVRLGLLEVGQAIAEKVG